MKFALTLKVRIATTHREGGRFVLGQVGVRCDEEGGVQLLALLVVSINSGVVVQF